MLPMNRWIKFILLLFLAGCRGEEDNSYLTAEKAREYFNKIEDACNRDDGILWGKNLYGPMIFVDRTTRKITANQPDLEGILKEKDGVYTGTYPRELMINNIPVTFGGTVYALVPLPAEEDGFRIISRSIHSLFHFYQESSGYKSTSYNISIMDEKNARLWIKLEWKALRKAITAEGAEKQLAIRDALIFRGSNRESYQNYAEDETRFENYEGLATFTYIMLSTDSPEDYLIRLFEYLDRIYSYSSYARSYGFIHGALYATLLHQKGFDFKTLISENTDLGFLVKELYQIKLPDMCRDIAGSIAMNYDVENIMEEETQRDKEIRERIHRRTGTFTEKPVVFFELESPYFDFEPEDIHPMDTLGTIYSKIRVSDNWGKLTVDKGGCLVSNNFRYLRITARGFKEDKNRIEGEGWHLILNNDWELVQIDQNYLVRKRML
ncbi:MAG: hypothetical protein A2Z69_00795 [Bacteroidetes bacterium RBG_13_44_24]|nr:MAG: hypothetical protein A2Z69_00795 [Bacteroidetes bacterium RBG_13_44_24]